MVDRFPQWMNLTRVVEVTAGTGLQSQTNTNINRSDFNVMEILAIEYKFRLPSLAGIDSDLSGRAQCSITTQSIGAGLIAALSAANCIDVAAVNMQFQAFEGTETGGGLAFQEETILHDFAGSGRGFLTAANIFFQQIDGIPSAGLLEVDVRILNRLHKVTVDELNGLLSELTN